MTLMLFLFFFMCSTLCTHIAVDLKTAPGSIYPGEPVGAKPGCTLTLADEDFLGLVTGDLNPQQVTIMDHRNRVADVFCDIYGCGQCVFGCGSGTVGSCAGSVVQLTSSSAAYIGTLYICEGIKVIKHI